VGLRDAVMNAALSILDGKLLLSGQKVPIGPSLPEAREFTRPERPGPRLCNYLPIENNLVASGRVAK